MRLTPHEFDKLSLHQVGWLAQKRLARGLRLNYPEAVALVSSQVMEFIRDGRHSVAELMDLGRRFLGRAEVMPGVPEMIEEVQVEGTFPDGTKLVTVHWPVSLAQGDLDLALYGSFFPVPSRQLFEKDKGHVEDGSADEAIGGYTVPEGELALNEGRPVFRLTVSNTGDRPIQVGSHYHFVETNRQLVFDRALAYGRRLDIPAGTAVRFEPGETKAVALVDIAGLKVIKGGNGLATGPVDEARRAGMGAAALAAGFGHRQEGA